MLEVITLIGLILLTAALVVVAVYMFAYLIYYAAKHKIWSTFPESGTMELVGSGSDENGQVAKYVETLANVPKYKMAKSCVATITYWEEKPSEDKEKIKRIREKNPDTEVFDISEPQTVKVTLEDALIPFKGEKMASDGRVIGENVKEGNIRYTKIEYYPDGESARSKWENFVLGMFAQLGFVKKEEIYYRWVSLFGVKRIGSFPIVKARQKDDKERKGKPLTEWVQTDEPEDVQFFIWKSQRPLVVANVELKDGSKCHFLVSITIQFVVPQKAAFVWKHRFYRTVESAIEATIVGWARHRSYAQLVRYEQTGPSSEFFQRALSRLNALGSNDENEGFLKSYGVTLVQGWIEAYDLAEEDRAILEAAKAKELAERRGDALITEKEKTAEGRRREAAGEADATRALGLATAQAFSMLFAQAMEVTKGDRDLAREMVLKQLEVNKIDAFKGDALVEGGPNVMPTIPLIK